MLVGSLLVATTAWRGCGSTRDTRADAKLARVFDAALLFFVAVATSGLLTQAIKHVVGRARPNAAGSLGAFAFHPFSFSNVFASFPSGHATSAFAAATLLGRLAPGSRPVLFLLATVIAGSRVILREHYLSDVLGGAALGTMVSLGLTRTPVPTAAIGVLRAWLVQLAEAGRWRNAWARRDRRAPVVALGSFFARHWSLPALAAGVFAVAMPPTDLFGSETAEQVKDSCAILIALIGLTVRSLVAGYGDAAEPFQGRTSRPSRLKTDGLHALCRQPLEAGNILIFTGIFLMHGNRWTVICGTASYLLIHLAMARAEEDHLVRTFGTVYEAYRRRVPRWRLDFTRLRPATRMLRFDPRRMLNSEYPVIGMTVVALTAAEFYEELGEPLARWQAAYLLLLGAVILGVSAAVGTIWLAKRSAVTLPET